MLTLFRTLLLAVVVAGCSLIGGTSAALTGRTFLSTGIVVDGQPHRLVDGTQIRLTFGANGDLSAQAGCNTMGARYHLDGGVLRIEEGGTTLMGCDQPRQDQDAWLFGVLGAHPTVALTGNDLIIRSGTTVLTLVDREVAEPDLPLVGTLWTVTTIFVASDAGMGMVGMSATLQFDAAGRVTFNTGCNTGGGRYAIDGNRLHFTELVTTDRACAGDGSQMEAAVVQTLSGDPVWAIDANTLTLRIANGERGLGLQGTPGS